MAEVLSVRTRAKKRCGVCRPCQNPRWKKACLGPTPESDAIPSAPTVARRRPVAKPAPCTVDIEQLRELAELLNVDPSVFNIRRIGDDYVLLDIVTSLTGSNKKSSKQLIKTWLLRYPEMAPKVRCVVVQGREKVSVSDLYGAVELALWLPGILAAQVRFEAARTLVRCLGGDVTMAEEIIANREKQEALRVNEPQHAARAFGEQVESELGPMDEQRMQFERHLQTVGVRVTKYDPSKLSEVHHAFKDECNAELLRGIKKVFGSSEKLAEKGYAVVLDDFDAQGRLRTISLLTSSGFPVGKVLAPNKELSVVERVVQEGARGVHKHVREALGSDFVDLNVSLAYLDTTSGDVTEIRSMIKQVQANHREGALLVAYTMCWRSFTPGGAMTFTERVLHLLDYMRSCGFEPLFQNFENSYKEYRDRAQMVATCFWVRLE